MRFGIEGRPVIDCAVALHDGVFHLFAPDNGTTLNPGAPPPRQPGEPRPECIGYHATSRDGLHFTRQPDVKLTGAPNWLGNAQSDGKVIRFFGTGGPRGVWVGVSTNGESWTLDETFPPVPGADPGAVKLKDGHWLFAVTGPPRDGPRRQPDGAGQRPHVPPLLATFDTNRDGELDAHEIDTAPAILRKLDRNGDGKLKLDEMRPPNPAF